MDLGYRLAGRYVSVEGSAYWDGQTERGEDVSSGTYFYQLQAGDYTETRKMVILKSAPPNIVIQSALLLASKRAFLLAGDWLGD